MQISSLSVNVLGTLVRVRVTDFNRLRWSAVALEANTELQNSLHTLAKNKTAWLTDSTYLMSTHDLKLTVPEAAHVILWDGLNSYIELMNARPELKNRPDIQYFCVGYFDEILKDSPVNMKALFLADADQTNHVRDFYALFSLNFMTPFWFRLLCCARTFSRFFKNWYSDAVRNKALMQGKKIVFCGLITPNPSVITAMFRGVNQQALCVSVQQMSRVSWQSDHLSLVDVAANVIHEIKQANLVTGADFSCVYAVLNILQRMLTVSALYELKSDVFVSEFGVQSHIDPYDSFAYSQHVYIDFGSTRGPDSTYPRTLDMVMTGKHFMVFRFLSKQQSLADYIEQLSPALFMAQCQQDALLAHQKLVEKNAIRDLCTKQL